MPGKFVHGVGINDLSGCSNTDAYHKWSSMIQRCYDVKWHAKFPTYQDCFVKPEWLYFSNFKNWFDRQRFEEGWQLDKDLLIRGNTMYGPDSCILVPRWVNILVTDSLAKRGVLPIGVSFHKGSGKYQAQLKKDGVKTHLGYFNNPEDAYLIWMRNKLDHVADKKESLDAIDKRLYHRIVEIIKEQR
ncbi:hypothetical protein PJM37_0030 [Salmonella phage vB_SenM_UTK0004]|nr:hypothetical protein PJM37_0030 [Salmonella phage vB_SenM_UTK0004]